MRSLKEINYIHFPKGNRLCGTLRVTNNELVLRVRRNVQETEAMRDVLLQYMSDLGYTISDKPLKETKEESG